jgi:DNA (cytosine-5)-methyltransferase 1
VKKQGKRYSYRIGYQLVLAKDYGVPQNRPRVLLLGLREDIPFQADDGLPADGLLPAPTYRAPHPTELLGDLEDPDWTPGGATTEYASRPVNQTQRWLRRNLEYWNGSRPGLTDHEYSRHSDRVIQKFRYMIENEGEIPQDMKTKKFAQRVLPREWGAKGPTITATSLPDDYVHYSQPRVLTVREWARLQMFPDQYLFLGKRTTGGRRRAGDPSTGDWSRDLPKYTQIGNAVPVALAKAVGDHLRPLLS